MRPRQPLTLPDNIPRSEYDSFIQLPGSDIVLGRNQMLNDLTREDQFKELAYQHLHVVSSSLFIPYLLHVNNAYQKRTPLLTVSGKELTREQVRDLHTYLFRRCWINLNDEFIEGDGYRNFSLLSRRLFLGDNNLYREETMGGIREKSIIRPLEKCLMTDVQIDLAPRAFNTQGLPTKKSKQQKYEHGKTLSYQYPSDFGFNINFIANVDCINLDCRSHGPGTSPHQGVIPCVEGVRQKTSRTS